MKNHSFELHHCRSDFPILERKFQGNPLVYLDSAATALKPRCVIQAVCHFYEHLTANVHRAVHQLGEETTAAFEDARARIARFIHAEPHEIVFVRHATEALNMVAGSLPEDAEILVPISEHHSNLLPWLKGKRTLIHVDSKGVVAPESFEKILRSRRVDLVTLSSISNAFGTRQPVSEIVKLAREHGVLTMLDVSQQVGHEPLDVRKLDVDFLCFSGHKMCGPSGLGVLYVKESVQNKLSPWLLGGSMVKEVGLDRFTCLEFPWNMEAGTPNMEGVFGLAAACEYLDSIGLDRIHGHHKELMAELIGAIRNKGDITIHGTPEEGAIICFSVKEQDAHGVARMLSNRFGIMVRSGFHCAQPLHKHLGLKETVRISFHLYNTMEEVDLVMKGMDLVCRFA